MILLSIELSDYRSTGSAPQIHVCIVWWWFACITIYANNCICLFVLIKGERYLDVTLTKSSGFEYCNLGMQYTWLRLLLVTWPPRISKTGHLQLRSVPSGNTALHPAASSQPALTLHTYFSCPEHGLIVDKCGVVSYDRLTILQQCYPQILHKSNHPSITGHFLERWTCLIEPSIENR